MLIYQLIESEDIISVVGIFFKFMLTEILEVCYHSREEPKITCSRSHALLYCMGKRFPSLVC